MRALLVCALFLAASLAVGGASAQPDPPQCVHGGIEQSVGPVTVGTTCGEGPYVEVDEDCLRDGSC